MTPAATAMLASKVRVARDGITHHVLDSPLEGPEDDHGHEGWNLGTRLRFDLVPRPRAWIGVWGF